MVVLAYQYVKDPSLYYRYNIFGMLISHVIIVIYSIVYFYKSLSQKPLFLYVNTGLFLYLLSSALLFALGNQVYNLKVSVSNLNLLVGLNSLFYALFQILVLVEWWKNYRTKVI